MKKYKFLVIIAVAALFTVFSNNSCSSIIYCLYRLRTGIQIRIQYK
ncbi:MAG: hypothetical protein H6Q20_1692 [Bacteroidetes bacterium]|nr:hypothetical protein [Bacteroidota bacterium]